MLKECLVLISGAQKIKQDLIFTIYSFDALYNAVLFNRNSQGIEYI